MSDRILIPYDFLDEELQCIKNNFATHTDWTKDVFSNIKKNIMVYLRFQQSNVCCYCKYPLGFDIKQVDIEHIIPKSEYEKFTFESRNLALSCPGCNTKKSTNPVLHGSIKNYPKNGNNFTIIHAHYDEYSDHIDIINNCVFVAKTKKGSYTILLCELFRLKIAEQKAKAFQTTSSSTLQELVDDLSNPDMEGKDKLFNFLKDAIR